MKIVRCYDNGGETMDRYTVVYLDQQESKEPRGVYYDCRAMSANPFHPQGFGQMSTCVLGPHLGKRIAFADLPFDCQRLVFRDRTPEVSLTVEAG
jgi:hypothetical protein